MTRTEGDGRLGEAGKREMEGVTGLKTLIMKKRQRLVRRRQGSQANARWFILLVKKIPVEVIENWWRQPLMQSLTNRSRCRLPGTLALICK